MTEMTQPRSVVVEVPTLKVDMAPFQFQRFAAKYLEVAHLVPETNDGFTPVPYYLVCRSLELALKAYCLPKGINRKTLRERKESDIVC